MEKGVNMNSINNKQDEIVSNNILLKTKELAYVYGIKRLTVDQIAAECGVSKKTIYKHFENKDHLVFEAANLFIQEGVDAVNELKNAKLSTNERLLKLFEVPFTLFKMIPRILLEDVYKYYPDIEERAQRIRDIHKEVFIKTLNDGFKKGLFRKHNPIIILALFDSAGDRMLNTQFMLENNLTVEEIISGFRSLITEGLIIE